MSEQATEALRWDVHTRLDAGRVTACSGASATEVLGFAAAELVGRSFDELVAAPQPDPAPWATPGVRATFAVRGPDGCHRWVEARSAEGQDGQIDMITRSAPVGSDVLVRWARLSFFASLLGPLAHELNNVAQGLAALEFLLADWVEGGEPLESEDAEQLGASAKALRGIGVGVQKWVYADLEEGRVADVGHSLRHVLHALATSGVGKSASITVDAPEGLNVAVPPAAFDLACAMIIGNAVNAASGSRDPTITVEATLVGNTVEVAVRDNGPGLLDVHPGQAPGQSTKPPARHGGLGWEGATSLLERAGGWVQLREASAGGCLVVLGIPKAE